MFTFHHVFYYQQESCNETEHKLFPKENYALFLSHVKNTRVEKWFKDKTLSVAENWEDSKLNLLMILKIL